MHPAPDAARGLQGCELFKLLQITEEKHIYFQKQIPFNMYMASQVCVCVFSTYRFLSVFGREEAIHRARALGCFLSSGSTLMGRDYFDTNIKAADQSEIRAHVRQSDGAGGHKKCEPTASTKKDIFLIFSKFRILIFYSLFSAILSFSCI